MQITPEVRAQLDEQKKQCIFCKLISGEMEARTVFEDDLTIGMLDINPARKGHTLFMLKEHYPIMPYIPQNEFVHYFGLVSALSKAVMTATVSTGMNVFVANGGAAGQQAPHFLIHLLPRDDGDGFLNFFFKQGQSLQEEQKNMLANNLPIMMNNHFGRLPAPWHKGAGETPSFLKPIAETNKVLYEDEKSLVVIPEESIVPGHIKIYSKAEERDVANLSQEDCAHLFYVASYAATAVFEGLGAHATNILVKSGKTDDNPDGLLCFHVIPRSAGDSLQGMQWSSKPPSYDLDSVASKIKDKTWKITYTEPEVKKEVVTEDRPPQNEIEKAIQEAMK